MWCPTPRSWRCGRGWWPRMRRLPPAVPRRLISGHGSRPTCPWRSTSFVGRVWEVRDRGALATARLVTLTGPGGAGKTRLALAVADPGGVHPRWRVAGGAGRAGRPPVPGAAHRGSGAGCRRAARAVDARHPGRLPASAQAAAGAGQLRASVAACAELAAALLAACPLLRLLATSREGLEVAGERTYRVPPLAVPDPAHLPPLEQLAAYDAVQLFVERAQARRPELRLRAANAGAVAQICARLDGLPLAIELAAARVGALPVEGIAARLDDRFRLLTGGPRTALPRQQTLRATLDWSYSLLDRRNVRAAAAGGLRRWLDARGSRSGVAGAVASIGRRWRYSARWWTNRWCMRVRRTAGCATGSWRPCGHLRRSGWRKRRGHADLQGTRPLLSRTGRTGGNRLVGARPGHLVPATYCGAGQPARGAGMGTRPRRGRTGPAPGRCALALLGLSRRLRWVATAD